MWFVGRLTLDDLMEYDDTSLRSLLMATSGWFRWSGTVGVSFICFRDRWEFRRFAFGQGSASRCDR